MSSFIRQLLSLTPLLLFFSISAHATPEVFKGSWQGKGTYIFNGDLTQCASVGLIFDATLNTFRFVGGNRTCDKHQEQFFPVSMTFRDGLIYFNGQKVGSYTSNTLEAQYRMPEGNSFRNWRMFMRREGNHLMYEESRTMEGEKTPLISFSGLLVIQ